MSTEPTEAEATPAEATHFQPNGHAPPPVSPPHRCSYCQYQLPTNPLAAVTINVYGNYHTHCYRQTQPGATLTPAEAGHVITKRLTKQARQAARRATEALEASDRAEAAKYMSAAALRHHLKDAPVV